jgi:hypothetical protein
MKRARFHFPRSSCICGLPPHRYVETVNFCGCRTREVCRRTRIAGSRESVRHGTGTIEAWLNLSPSYRRFLFRVCADFNSTPPSRISQRRLPLRRRLLAYVDAINCSQLPSVSQCAVQGKINLPSIPTRSSSKQSMLRVTGYFGLVNRRRRGAASPYLPAPVV